MCGKEDSSANRKKQRAKHRFRIDKGLERIRKTTSFRSPIGRRKKELIRIESKLRNPHHKQKRAGGTYLRRHHCCQAEPPGKALPDLGARALSPSPLDGGVLSRGRARGPARGSAAAPPSLPGRHEQPSVHAPCEAREEGEEKESKRRKCRGSWTGSGGGVPRRRRRQEWQVATGGRRRAAQAEEKEKKGLGVARL